MAERTRVRYGDWRDEWIPTADWRRWLAKHVDPEPSEARIDELNRPGGLPPEAHALCLCACHDMGAPTNLDGHCGPCRAYWTPRMPDSVVQRIGQELRPEVTVSRQSTYLPSVGRHTA